MRKSDQRPKNLFEIRSQIHLYQGPECSTDGDDIISRKTINSINIYGIRKEFVSEESLSGHGGITFMLLTLTLFYFNKRRKPDEK